MKTIQKSLRIPGPVVQAIEELAESGAGEIIITSIERDGTMCGYDLALIQEVVGVVNEISVFFAPRTVSVVTVALLAIAALMNPCGVSQICASRPSTAVRWSRSGAADTAFWPTMSHAYEPLRSQVCRCSPASGWVPPPSGGFWTCVRLRSSRHAGVV